MVENNYDVELENKNTKNHMIQVRMNDEQFRKFWMVRKKLKATNNSAALRLLVELAANNNAEFVTDGQQKQELMEDVSASNQALLRQVTGIATNVNQVAHGINVLVAGDPDNEESWNWVVTNVQAVQRQLPALKQLITSIKQKVGD